VRYAAVEAIVCSSALKPRGNLCAELSTPKGACGVPLGYQHLLRHIIAYAKTEWFDARWRGARSQLDECGTLRRPETQRFAQRIFPD
jgi:hypothetical protein